MAGFFTFDISYTSGKLKRPPFRGDQEAEQIKFNLTLCHIIGPLSHLARLQLLKRRFFWEQDNNDINNLEPCRASVSDLTSELEERRWAGKSL